MAASYAGLALTMPLMRLWQVTLPVMLLHAAGMALLVSPLSTAVMLAVAGPPTPGSPPASTMRWRAAAGLMAVAALGAVRERDL